jgi:hypothetical protein
VTVLILKEQANEQEVPMTPSLLSNRMCVTLKILQMHIAHAGVLRQG